MNDLVDPPSEINSGRHYPYATVGHWVLLHPDISNQARALYAILRAHVNVRRNGSERCNPQQEDIAAICGVKRQAIGRWTKELEAIGAVEVTEIRDPETGTKRLIYDVHEAPPERFSGIESVGRWHDLKKTITSALKPNPLAPDDQQKHGHVRSSELGHVRSSELGHVRSSEHKEPEPKNLNLRTTHNTTVGTSPAREDTEPTPPADDDDSAVPDTRDGVCDPETNPKNRDNALDAIIRTIPTVTRDRMTNTDKRSLLELCIAVLDAGASPLALRECLSGAGVDDRTTHPMKRLTTPLTNLAARTASQEAERAERAAQRLSACGRTDCRDGRIVCSADCPPICDAGHDPIGVPCPQCRPGETPATATTIPVAIDGITTPRRIQAMIRDVAQIIADDEDRDQADVIADITGRAAELVADNTAPEARTPIDRIQIIMSMVLAEQGRDWRKRGVRLAA